MKKKIIAIAILTAMIIILFAGCSAGPVERPAMKTGATAFNVTGSCQGVLNGNILTVSGTSNIADGTFGTISVYSADGKLVETATIVKSGANLTHDFTVTDAWPSEVYGFVSFDTNQSGTQPQAILDMYGAQFENLQGTDTLWDTHGVAAVFQSDIVKIR